MSGPTYHFGPRPRRGVALGLKPAQAVAVVLGVAGATVVVLATHQVVIGFLVLATAGMWTFLPVRGRPPHAWAAPLAAQLLGPRRARPALVTRRFGQGGSAFRSRTPGSRWDMQLPGLGRLRIEEACGDTGGVALVHAGGGPPCFTLALGGPRFALDDTEVQGAIVSAWGAVLNACATSRVSRIQVTERAVPDAGGSQYRWLAQAATPVDPSVVASYREHVGLCLEGAVRHEVYLSAAMPAGRSNAPVTVAAECAALVELLRAGGFDVRPLVGDEMCELIHSMLTAGAPRLTGSRSTRGLPGAWERTWDLVRTAGTCHTCFEAIELPRVPLGADWVWGLIQNATPNTERRLALHIELAPAAAGLRRAQRAVLAHEGDEAVRARWGFRSGARTEHEAEAARVREAELAAGFADARFALLLATTAPDPGALETSARHLEAQAASSQLELRRLYGQQAEALIATLPLARLRLAGGWG